MYRPQVVGTPGRFGCSGSGVFNMGMRKRYSVKNIITEFAYDHRNMQKKVRKVHESAKELSNLLDKMEEKAEKKEKK